MGNILESLIVPLLADTDKFIKSLGDAQKTADKSTKAIADKWKSSGESMMKVGAVLDVAVTAPIVALGKKSVDAASDLSETMSKVGVVFGKNADDVIKFGDNAAKALGMSKNAALSAAGVYGNLFVSMGMTTDKSADMSKGLVTLAADLASFNNMDSTEVLDKLRAGLTGESEPLKTLGVNLNAAMVEQKALNMGLWDGEGALSASAKAQATYALVLEQTKTAQGDFARTSDGLANSQRILQAEFENLQADLGQALLPVMTDLTKAIIPLINNFNNLDPQVKKNIVIALGLIAALGPLISIIGGTITTVSSLISILGTLGTVGTFISGTALPAVGTAIGIIGLPVIALVAAIGLLIATIAIFGKDAWNTVTMIGKIIEVEFGRSVGWVKDRLAGSFNSVTNAISNALGWVDRLAGKLASLRIPSWLQMHSPPPLATALSMVGQEMRDLSSTTLPKFNAELNVNGNLSVPSVSNIQPGFNQKQQQQIKIEIDYNKLAYAMRDINLRAI